MKTTAMLTEMLHSERALRIDAQADLVSAQADVRFFKTRNDELQETVDFLNGRNSVLVRENADLSYRGSFNRDRENLEALQQRYDRLVDSMAAFSQPIVERIFNEDPAERRTNKIPFIKAVREQTGLGLKESKDLVDQFLIIDKVAQDKIEQDDLVKTMMENAALAFDPE